MTQRSGKHEFVCVDGEVVPRASASVPAVSASALIGKGVFTTAAVFGGKVFQIDRHLDRLEAHASAIGLGSAGRSRSLLSEWLEEVIGANGIGQGKVRVTLLEAEPPGNWPPGKGSRTMTVIQTGDLPRNPGALKLGISNFPVNSRSPLAGVKSCSYLEPLMAADEARRLGFDESVRVNENGDVVSACLANLFWRSRADGRWRTPSIASGCLAGTTRAYVLDRVGALETACGLEEMRSEADSIFITSAARGIAPVSFLDGLELRSPEPEILSLLPGYLSQS